MQRLSSFSHAWTHVVQYRAQSLLPCPFYHKSQSSEASNHKSTDEATIISLFADSASPSSSSRNHLTALSWTDDAIVYSQQYQSFGSTDFLDANKVVVSACRRHLRMTYRGLPQWCSPSNDFAKLQRSRYRRRHHNGEGSQIVTTSIFLYTRPVYQNYNLQKATNTNRGKIDGVCLVLATKDINIPCMHAEVRRLVCMALHYQAMRSEMVSSLGFGEKIHIN